MLKQPVGFVKLTNVALVKYRVGGKKVEIACYKNKVIDWRNGVEKNISEVLQIEEIFTNAIQGEVANKKILEDLFPKQTKRQIIAIILDKGEMQISQKERENLMENTFKDVLNIISKKIVHPKSKRLFSVESIKEALKEANFNLKFNQTSKRQAQDGIHLLERFYVFERVGMLVKVWFGQLSDFETLRQKFTFEVEKTTAHEAFIIINSKTYHEFEKLVEEEMKEKIELVIIDNAYFNKESQNIDTSLETTLQRKEGVELPKTIENNKNNQKKEKEEKKDNPEEEVKKVVLGFDAMQLKLKESKVKPEEEKICATCLNEKLANLKDYKDHIKSDWHKFNLNRKMKKEDGMSFEQFRDYLVMEDFVKK